MARNLSEIVMFCLVLGDNIFYGDKLVDYLKKGLNNLKKNSSTIYGLDVINPKEFGVVKFGQ